MKLIRSRRHTMIRFILPLILTGAIILTADASPALADPPATVTVPGNDAFQLGWKYDQGLGTPINIPEAMKAYEQAAAAGNPIAKSRMARYYFGGNGVVADRVKAEQ